MLTEETLIGSWISIRSDIPEYKEGSEVYHFSEDKVFRWEFPFEPKDDLERKYNYSFSEGILTYHVDDDNSIEIEASLEDEQLHLKPDHGHETVFERYIKEEGEE